MKIKAIRITDGPKKDMYVVQFITYPNKPEYAGKYYQFYGPVENQEQATPLRTVAVVINFQEQGFEVEWVA